LSRREHDGGPNDNAAYNHGKTKMDHISSRKSRTLQNKENPEKNVSP